MCRDFGREAEGREALKVVRGEQPGVSDVRPAQGGLFGVWGAGGGDGMGVGEEPPDPGLCLVPGPLGAAAVLEEDGTRRDTAETPRDTALR